MKFAGSLLQDSEKAIYEIIGVPFDDNATIKGASNAPEMIRRASQRLETFMWHNKLELSDLLYYDCGDLHDITDLDIDTGKRKIFIGGDHSISYPLFKYYFERQELTRVVVIDAHADFRDVYMGNRFSNACVMRRIAELAGVENVIEIGVRSASWEEYEFMKNRVRILDVDVDVDDTPEELELEGKLYLSIDIDVLDPGIAPGVEYPEPCGMSLEALIRLVRRIIKRGDVVACDIVEVNPQLDIKNGITCLNAAKLVFEVLASYWLRDHTTSRENPSHLAP